MLVRVRQYFTPTAEVAIHILAWLGSVRAPTTAAADAWTCQLMTTARYTAGKCVHAAACPAHQAAACVRCLYDSISPAAGSHKPLVTCAPTTDNSCLHLLLT
jgi:hypothetical protein